MGEEKEPAPAPATAETPKEGNEEECLETIVVKQSKGKYKVQVEDMAEAKMMVVR